MFGIVRHYVTLYYNYCIILINFGCSQYMVYCFRVGTRSRDKHVTKHRRVVRSMAPVSRKRHVSSAAPEQQTEKRVKIDLNNKVVTILQSKKHANAVFDIFEVLQVK